MSNQRNLYIAAFLATFAACVLGDITLENAGYKANFYENGMRIVLNKDSNAYSKVDVRVSKADIEYYSHQQKDVDLTGEQYVFDFCRAAMKKDGLDDWSAQNFPETTVLKFHVILENPNTGAATHLYTDETVGLLGENPTDFKCE